MPDPMELPPRRWPRRGVLLAAAALAATAGHAAGALVLVGGGDIPLRIAARFTTLAGGADRRYVCIPTAAADNEIIPAALEAEFCRGFGVRAVTLLHTRDRRVADQPAFAAALDRADAVWFGGGRQWRIADAYLGTRTEAGLRRLFARGGVIGGTSAGASILASYLVRGAPEGNRIVSAAGHEQGFALLPDAAVDQHVDRYHREDDIDALVQRRPELLGLGIDEATAIVVIGTTATVIGRGRVLVHDGRTHGGRPYMILRDGDQFSLGARTGGNALAAQVLPQG